MARRKTHKDVEFLVQGGYARRKGDKIFKRFDEAAAHAVDAAIASGDATIDVLVWSRSGARWLGGSDAVEQYDEDPEASVFERVELKANVVGRIA